MRVLFLDIDGVLNDADYFKNSHEIVLEYGKKYNYDYDNINVLLGRQMLDIDYNKLSLLRDIIIDNKLFVVIISSWKKLKIYPYIEEELIKFGIPIIGVTQDNGSDRGTGIKKYVADNNIHDYLVLDDDIFDDYDTEIMNRLIKTSFYNGGLLEKHKTDFTRKLSKKL